MNCLFLQGRLFKDIEVGTGKNNKYAKFTLMVQGRTKGEKGYNNDFFNCTAWGNTAERLEKMNVVKGDNLLIRGCISAQKYNEKTYWQVTVDEVISADKKNKETSVAPEGFNEIDDDVPFL